MSGRHSPEARERGASREHCGQGPEAGRSVLKPLLVILCHGLPLPLSGRSLSEDPVPSPEGWLPKAGVAPRSAFPQDRPQRLWADGRPGPDSGPGRAARLCARRAGVLALRGEPGQVSAAERREERPSWGSGFPLAEAAWLEGLEGAAGVRVEAAGAQGRPGPDLGQAGRPGEARHAALCSLP